MIERAGAKMIARSDSDENSTADSATSPALQKKLKFRMSRRRQLKFLRQFSEFLNSRKSPECVQRSLQNQIAGQIPLILRLQQIPTLSIGSQ